MERQGVPAVLLSGHHEQIERWRRDQRLAITLQKRPELVDAARAAGRLSAADEKRLRKSYNSRFPDPLPAASAQPLRLQTPLV